MNFLLRRSWPSSAGRRMNNKVGRRINHGFCGGHQQQHYYYYQQQVSSKNSTTSSPNTTARSAAVLYSATLINKKTTLLRNLTSMMMMGRTGGCFVPPTISTTPTTTFLRSFNTTSSLCLSSNNNKSSSSASDDSESSSSSESTSVLAKLTNGKYMNYAMLYHDSVAFLVSNDLGIPEWIYKYTAAQKGSPKIGGITPKDLALQFNLSIRGASAILVTLCRMDVVQVFKDNDYDLDDIQYTLTPMAEKFLTESTAATTSSASTTTTTTASTVPFISTFHTNFITPSKLLECCQPEDSLKDIMSEHLEESNDDVTNNARHFMNHMNAQSYSCAKILPSKLVELGIVKKSKSNDDDQTKTKTRFLDIGGGSGIFTIQFVQQLLRGSSKYDDVEGIIFELPAIQPITEEYVSNVNLSQSIKVQSGDFFTDDPFINVDDDNDEKVDIVFFSNILHDWPDDINMKLLQKAYDCLKDDGGYIVINEMLLADNIVDSSSSSTSMNIIMLPYTKGRQYRSKELHIRLSKLGFVNCKTSTLIDDYSLVIGEKKQS